MMILFLYEMFWSAFTNVVMVVFWRRREFATVRSEMQIGSQQRIISSQFCFETLSWLISFKFAKSDYAIYLFRLRWEVLLKTQVWRAREIATVVNEMGIECQQRIVSSQYFSHKGSWLNLFSFI